MAPLLFLLLVVAFVAWLVTHARLSEERKKSGETAGHIAQLQNELAVVRSRSDRHGGEISASAQHSAQAQQHIRSLEGQIAQLISQQQDQLDRRAERAVAASRGSFNGHIAQQAFPFAPHHSYNPKDIAHMGGVIDYVVFDGLHDIRNGNRDPKTLTVIFVDVKWGSSRVSDVQKAVIDAMNTGRTRGETWHAREQAPGQLTYNPQGAP